MTQPDSNPILEALTSENPERIRKALRSRLSPQGSLNLSGLGLSSLPEEVAELAGGRTFVRRVVLEENALTELPRVLTRLPDLEILDVRKNRLVDLPAWMAELAALTELNVSGNKLKELPGALFSSPRLSVVAGIPKFAKGPARQQLELFLSKTHGVEPSMRRALFDVFRGLELDQVPLSMLLMGLRGNFPELYEVVQRLIVGRGTKKKPGKGSRVVVLGSVNFKKSDLKAALEKMGAEYATRIDEGTTHLVLGKSPKEVEGADGRAFAFLTEAEAQKLAAGAHEGFITAADKDDAAAHGKNLNELLLSGDPASVEMALDLAKAGGIPEVALTGMFVIAKLGEDDKQRALARKLLKQYAPEAVNKVLADRGKLAYEGDKAERKTAENLAQYARMCKPIDWITVARFIRKRTGHGLSFVLTTKAPDALKLEVLRGEIKDGHLDYRDAYTPRYRPDYDNPHSYYGATPFPAILFELTELTGLDLSWCCFGTLPDDIRRLVNLQTLDLSGNMLRALPNTLVQLEQLRVLKVNGNALTDLPEVILRMPWLTHVEVRGNRRDSDSHLAEPLEVSAAVRRLMPNTTFVDGLSDWQERYGGLYM